MPLIMAKCLADAFDSTRCVQYTAGQVYEIDTESEIANLVVVPLGTTRTDKNGDLITIKDKRPARYVFEFDRAAPLGATGDGRPSDYTCKECGKKFKSLNALGSHVHTEHPVEVYTDGTEDEEVVVVKDGRGRKSARTFACKHEGCGQEFTNLYAYSQHMKTHQQVEVEAEPTTA